jgi:hypothetical protein
MLQIAQPVIFMMQSNKFYRNLSVREQRNGTITNKTNIFIKKWNQI